MEFLFGGIAGIAAATCIQPLDTIKVRLQITGVGQRGVNGSMIATARNIVATEGALGLYAGYSAAVARQAVYGTARMGLFRSLSDWRQSQSTAPGQSKRILPFTEKALIGCTAGAIAAVIGNPFDLALVRMQADGQLPPNERRGYKNVVDAVARITREEGRLSLWRGCLPTVYRAMAMNAGMLATYDQAKEVLSRHLGDSKTTNISASVISALAAATVTLPFDMLKTRLQQMKPLPDGAMPYRGSFDCATKIVMKEGVLALWKGWVTFCARSSPNSIITLLVNDALHYHWKQYKPRPVLG